MKKGYDQSNSIRTGLLALLALFLFFIGLAALICSIIDLFHGRASVYHYDQTQGGLKIESPLWPSSGKGFWVGLVLMATALVGFLASREGTRSAMFGFTTLAVLSTVLSFYMMITCIIPVQRNAEYTSSSTRQRWQTNELVLNSLLIAAGALGTIIGTIASILGCLYGRCFDDQRRSSLFKSDANRGAVGTPVSMRYPSGNVPPMVGFPYSGGNYRMPM